MTAFVVVACLVATVLAGMRWLRVAQREHYLAGSCTRFARRWWFEWGRPWLNRVLAVVAIINVASGLFAPTCVLLTAGAVAVGPIGLSIRGTAPGPVRWTRRLRLLAAVWAVLSLAVVGAGALVGLAAPAAAAVAVAAPALVDLALWLTAPVERRLAQRFVDSATKKLRSIGPTVIAITGSYGKTSTKGYAAHLIAAGRTVLATPASFNNSAGLSRAVNENLVAGTEVFVAEMGTYGPGEIAELCRWVRPGIAAITAIGPVHLERMGTEENIAKAKAEIFSTAQTCVLNVDAPLLAGMVEGLAAEGRRVVRCSALDRTADVVAATDGDGVVVVSVDGVEVTRIEQSDAARTNVAVAVALAREVGVPLDAIARRLADLPTAANRRTISTGTTGATFIDDTYNSNPAGAAAALSTLRSQANAAGRVVVVTPGMIELGSRQREENERFAAAVSAVATDLVVIGSTNRTALEAGAAEGGAKVSRVRDRAGATAWVKENTGDGDVVLFENDLPDHFA